MHYEWHGSQLDSAPVLVCSSGLGGSAHYWKGQLATLGKDYRILLYDHAGTGRSPATLPNGYSIEHMANELLNLLASLSVTRCNFIGHALGGLVGLVLAKTQPELINKLVLVNAWSQPNPHTLRCFAIRKALLANCEPQMFLQMQALILYPPDYIARHISELEQEEAHMLANFPNQANLLKRIDALSQFDIDASLAQIQARTLVYANKDDVLVPWQQSQHLADKLPNAQFRLFDYGGHASSVTTPNIFNSTILTFLSTQQQAAQAV
ncbi:pyrimidine utilization protein D [Aestuariibacter sp. GS-14]|uniref:pyrimidine utilization protein D n=1 Tax=Aestuariibacter sp. GS-14 TaxID=2590670 RepID=UPI001126B149|nr:pyrimidine utilization protein D [Aestuariibacter sp. GS-14]TPV57380.1 pyrimidine utilization protein D [Aestuariibacter sp. GS-14]